MRSRSFLLTLIAALFGILVPSAALASPPANDDFENADVIAGLPFADSGELGGTTIQPGEWTACASPIASSVWYRFTPSAAGRVAVDLAGSAFDVRATTYQWSGGGLAGLASLGCASAGPVGNVFTFDAVAGSTYYIQATSPWPWSAHLALGVQFVVQPPNDDFAQAEMLPVPGSDTVDMTASTLESGEPSPGYGPIGSVWYTVTPGATQSLQAQIDNYSMWVAVYTGSGINNLSMVGSANGYSPMYFQATAGTKYYLQVVQGPPFPGEGNTVKIDVKPPPPPTAAIGFWPSDPTIYDTVALSDDSTDPAGVGITQRRWDLGDGATATDRYPTHRYTADGDYTITLTVTTGDGRTATTTRQLSIRTHDIAIVRLDAPTVARVGQTRSVSVDLRGGRYPESVQVDLYKSMAGLGEANIGTKTVSVPAQSTGRATKVDFSYLFTADDRTAGKVSFRAVVSLLNGSRDALPADNLAIAPPTKVGG